MKNIFQFCFGTKKKGGILFFLIFIGAGSTCQVLNIDRATDEDTTGKKKWLISAIFNLSSDKQKNNLIDISSNLELDRVFKNKYVLTTLFQNDALFNGGSSIQNEGLMQARYLDKETRKNSIEGVVQYQWNGVWGMEYRKIAGANFRHKIIDKKQVNIYSATGFFYELERWNWKGVKDESLIPVNAPDIYKDRLRFNNYLKLAWKPSDKIDVAATSYLQFQLNNNFFKPRWFFDSNIYFNVEKHIGFTIHWDHIIDDDRPVPIDNFYYSFSFGVQLKY